LLLSHGADVNIKQRDGGTALYRAVCEGHLEVVKVLVSNGANVNAAWMTFATHTPLQVAIRNGNLEIVNLLKKHGAK
jgi:ankyrin repeat protein